MAYEFLGTDLTTEHGRQELFEVYEYLGKIGSEHLDVVDFYDIFGDWPREEVESQQALLSACARNDSPLIRVQAVRYADTVAFHDPNFVVTVWQQSLGDEADEVRHAAKSTLHDLLHSEQEEVIRDLGLSRLATIIRLYKQSGFEEELAARREANDREV